MFGKLMHSSRLRGLQQKMTYAFSSMEFPQWLIVAGALLLMLGFVGLLLRQRSVEADTIDMPRGSGSLEPEDELSETQGVDRTARLEEQKRSGGPTPRNRGTIDRKFSARKPNDRTDLRRYEQARSPDHLKVFANADAAEAWFAENDPEGVAFEHEVIEPPV